MNIHSLFVDNKINAVWFVVCLLAGITVVCKVVAGCFPKYCFSLQFVTE